MKRPTLLLNRILLDARLQVDTAVERDSHVIESRFKDEGMSFLTITLPSLCDALDQGLALGRISPDMFHGFKPCKRGGRLPALLQGFFTRIFDTDGSLLPVPCISSIDVIRQVTRLFKKVELPCSSARVKRAFERYKSNDEGVFDRLKLSQQCDSNFRAVAGYLWSDLEKLSGELYCLPGRFGSGATAERSRLNERHALREWNQRGENYFPLAAHGSHREDDVDSFNGVNIIPICMETPARVVSVPKTLKTPRIICVEPSHMMLRQQSVARPLMNWLESGRLGFRSIRFSDQSENRRLACVGSQDGSLATIDLSDASDLVSLDLCREVFKVCPTFWGYCLSSRTRRSQLPDSSIVNLRKFASMGSAMCFPIEAMVFFTIVMTAMVDLSGKRPSRSLLRRLSARVAVYGDDIIVPVEAASRVMEKLEAFGLRVNHEKSFYTGLFKESCGGDYYAGNLVTPVYCRRWDFTGNAIDPDLLLSHISLANQLYMKGYWNATQYVRDHVEKQLGYELPRSVESIGGSTWKSVSFNTQLKWNRCLHGYRVRTYSVTPRNQPDALVDVRSIMLRSSLGRPDIVGSAEVRNGLRIGVEFESIQRPNLGLLPDPKHLLQSDMDNDLYVSSSHDTNQGTVLERERVGYDRDPFGLSEGHSTRGLKTLLEHLRQPDGHIDGMSSVRPYALKSKRRWCPTRVGNIFS